MKLVKVIVLMFLAFNVAAAERDNKKTEAKTKNECQLECSQAQYHQNQKDGSIDNLF